jgi:osmotically-inducible protein OsmY
MQCLTNPWMGLAERVEARLRSNPYLALKNVSCQSPDSEDGDGGCVVLHGCVPSYYLKQIAQTVVGQVEGVRRIDNQIQVVRPAPRNFSFD